ncbi:MAG: hypothetical protein ACOCXX_00085 [Planctomycetota bacterium]
MSDKLLAFNNIRLRVPDEWDLTRATGVARSGRLALDDGHEPTLDATWGPLKEYTVEQLVTELVDQPKENRVIKRFGGDRRHRRLLVEGPEGTFGAVVAAQDEVERFVYVRVHKASPMKPRLEALGRSLSEKADSEVQPWRFFATSFDLPSRFDLTDVDLRSGCMRLDFASKRRALTLWDMSLLDRLERLHELPEMVAGMIEKAFVKRCKLFVDRLEPGEDPAAFRLPGRRNRRWMLSPAELLLGNRRVSAWSMPDRRSNRLAVVFYRYRREADLSWIDPLIDSLKGGRDEDVR